MRFKDLIKKVKNDDSNEKDHRRAREETGFWGRAGAGCIFLALDTNRILLNHRSDEVEQPNTWGVWGGAIDSGEKPIDAARREVQEEAGVSATDIVPLYIFHDKKSGFKYYNFLVLVDNEFTPSPNPDSEWETQGWDWFEFGQWPKPLHFGVVGILNDANSVRVIQSYMTPDEEND